MPQLAGGRAGGGRTDKWAGGSGSTTYAVPATLRWLSLEPAATAAVATDGIERSRRASSALAHLYTMSRQSQLSWTIRRQQAISVGLITSVLLLRIVSQDLQQTVECQAIWTSLKSVNSTDSGQKQILLSGLHML